MSKVFGATSEFSLINTTGNKTIVSYDREEVDDKNSTWYEIRFSKSHGEKPGIEQIKTAIIEDINDRTDEKILSGFVWTPEGAEPVNVWLSEENQRNFSEAQRMAEKYGSAVLPLTFKLGEKNGEPVYHTFETVEDLNQFYLSAFAWVNRCLNEGWQEKDNFDFTPYEEALDEDVVEAEE